MIGRSELLAKLDQEADAWDSGSGDIAALLREAKAEIEHLAGAAASHFQQAMLNGEKANERRAALEVIGAWECKGDSVAESYDQIFGSGAWERLLGAA